MLSYRKNNRLGYFYDIHSPNEFSLALGTQSPSYVVLRTNHRFVSKLVLWATPFDKTAIEAILSSLTQKSCGTTAADSRKNLDIYYGENQNFTCLYARKCERAIAFRI